MSCKAFTIDPTKKMKTVLERAVQVPSNELKICQIITFFFI